MKRIVCTMPDGKLIVIVPCINTRGEVDGFSEEDALARAMKDIPADAVNHRIVEPDDLPADRAYRDAWVDTGAAISHDMSKAKSIHKDALRKVRKAKLEALDVEYQRADETGDVAKKQSIASKKQALRDITSDPAINSAATVQDLKNHLDAFVVQQ